MRNNEIEGRDVANISPSDVADRLERLPEEPARKLLSELPTAETAGIIAELEPEKAAQLLHGFDMGKLVTILQQLSPNQTADLLPALSAPERDRSRSQCGAAGHGGKASC